MPTDAEKATQQITSAINFMGLRPEEIATQISNDHPTLQQDFMRICLSYIRVMSEKTRGIDLRNQDSVELAKQIAGKLRG